VDALAQKFSFQSAGRNLGRLLTKEYVDAMQRCQLGKNISVPEYVPETAEENNRTEVAEQEAEVLRPLALEQQKTEGLRCLSSTKTYESQSPEIENIRNVSIENDNRSIELSTTTTSTSERRSRNLDQGVAAAEIANDLGTNLAILREETEVEYILPRLPFSPVPVSEIPQDVHSPPRPESDMVNPQEAEEETSLAVAEKVKESPSIVGTLNMLTEYEQSSAEKDLHDGVIRVKFSDICKGRSRRVVAKHFYNILALQKTENVESSQEEMFEEIEVTVL